MKRVVVRTGLQEAEIRPPNLFSEFKRLSTIDAVNYFSDASRLVEVACPACGCEDRRGKFRKTGFMYNECTSCRSLFVSPRPNIEALNEYYATSAASRYRKEHYARETANARRFHVLRSNVFWMAQIAAWRSTGGSYVDIGTLFPALYDEVHSQQMFEQLYSLEPLADLRDVAEKLGVVLCTDPPQGVGVATAFEQLESQFSPAGFVETAANMLDDGGVLFMTTRTGSGFDHQILQDRTPYVFVPEHLNLLSVEGISVLVERCGLELLELSTPGQLDLELVEHAAAHDPSIRLPDFVRYLLDNRDSEAHLDFQSFLQKHRLSSHVRIAALKNAKEIPR